MKKLPIAIFLILMFLLITAPKLQAQGLVCEEANGLNWCYNPQECGQACNDVCAAGGMQPVEDNEVWFQAQNTAEKCQAIADVFGLNEFRVVPDNAFTCLADRQGDHSQVALIEPLLCTLIETCPSAHRTITDNQGVSCDRPNSRRAICPCEPLISNVPTLSEWGLIAMAGILGVVGFMVIRRRKVTA